VNDLQLRLLEGKKLQLSIAKEMGESQIQVAVNEDDCILQALAAASRKAQNAEMTLLAS